MLCVSSLWDLGLNSGKLRMGVSDFFSGAI